jgi:hypothetical protein
MVLSANKINYKGEPGINSNYYVTRDNTSSRQPKPPQTYSDSWYVRETATYGSTSATAVDKEQRQSCWCWSKSTGAAEPAMRYTNGPQSAASMVASYGVYNDASLRGEEDDDGFIPRANVYRGVVVNAAGDSSVVRPSHLQEPAPAETNSCGWCISSRSSTTTPPPRNSCLVTWCRPTILLLILVLLVVFLLVSAILLYFNCTFRCFYVCMCRKFRC